MLVDSSNPTAGSAVTGAIRQASQATGTSFNYLLATAKVESGLNPQAGASTSSARGLFQFIEQTWLSTIKQFGGALGYGGYAAAITQTGPGHYEVKDPSLRSEILKLRNDPTANAVMAGAFTKANAAVLSQRLGRSPSEGELYIAHFLGVGGAARLITIAANNPHANAADFFPSAAQSNPSIFYDRSTGNARTVAQVRNILTARYDVAALTKPGSASQTASNAAPSTSTAENIPPAPIPVPNLPSVPVAPPAPPATATAAPDTAGITSAFAAAVPTPTVPATDIFHGLFQDTDHAAPLGSAVSALWGVTNSNNAAADAAASVGMLDLFKDTDASRRS